MPKATQASSQIKIENFTENADVQACLQKLNDTFDPHTKPLIVSDVLDQEGNQYVNLVQKGGGVLGIALVGYTYILEKMGIRFLRLAGTSAGAINTSLMAVIAPQKDKTKSDTILKYITELNFFKLVDGHPAAKWFIKNFITNKEFSKQ